MDSRRPLWASLVALFGEYGFLLQLQECILCISISLVIFLTFLFRVHIAPFRDLYVCRPYLVHFVNVKVRYYSLCVFFFRYLIRVRLIGFLLSLLCFCLFRFVRFFLSVCSVTGPVPFSSYSIFDILICVCPFALSLFFLALCLLVSLVSYVVISLSLSLVCLLFFVRFMFLSMVFSASVSSHLYVSPSSFDLSFPLSLSLSLYLSASSSFSF